MTWLEALITILLDEKREGAARISLINWEDHYLIEIYTVEQDHIDADT